MTVFAPASPDTPRPRRRVGQLFQRFTRLLAVAAGTMVLILVAFNVFEWGREGAPDGAPTMPPPGNYDSRRVENPRYTTQLPNGEPLFVSADWAIPDGVDPDRIRLSNVIARSAQLDGVATTAKADTGFLYLKLNRLVLAGQVRYFGADGAQFQSDRVAFDANDRTLRSTGPVTYETPDSRLTAGNLLVRESPTGRRLVFAGGVHAVYEVGLGGNGS